MIDLDGIVTQAEFGQLVGISQPAVSGLVQRGVVASDGTAREWLLAYCEHIRGIAAGRGGDDGAGLAAARKRLADEQADRIAMQNAVTRKELAPAHLLEEVLAKTGARAAKILDTIPGEIRRRAPQLTSDDIAAIALVVAKARNLAASMSMAVLDVAEDDERDLAPGDAVIDAEVVLS